MHGGVCEKGLENLRNSTPESSMFKASRPNLGRRPASLGPVRNIAHNEAEIKHCGQAPQAICDRAVVRDHVGHGGCLQTTPYVMSKGRAPLPPSSLAPPVDRRGQLGGILPACARAEERGGGVNLRHVVSGPRYI